MASLEGKMSTYGKTEYTPYEKSAHWVEVIKVNIQLFFSTFRKL